tara:strand:- start:431 stop:754 length:324 start_codon:yes stop_codon:yes gene_type:complete
MYKQSPSSIGNTELVSTKSICKLLRELLVNLPSSVVTNVFAPVVNSCQTFMFVPGSTGFNPSVLLSDIASYSLSFGAVPCLTLSPTVYAVELFQTSLKFLISLLSLY